MTSSIFDLLRLLSQELQVWTDCFVYLKLVTFETFLLRSPKVGLSSTVCLI